MKKFFDSAIKLNELYGAVEKHLKAHIQNFDEKRVATSLSLFNPSVPYILRITYLSPEKILGAL